MRNKTPYSLLRPSKPNVEQGDVALKIHYCALLLDFLVFFRYIAHMSLFSRISPTLMPPLQVSFLLLTVNDWKDILTYLNRMFDDFLTLDQSFPSSEVNQI